jgi:hypothetical protein
MLVEQIALSTLLGMITALFIALYTVLSGDDKKDGYTLLFLGSVGGFTGSLTGMAWIFLTGGLEYSLISVFFTVMATILVSFVAIGALPGILRNIRKTTDVSNLSTFLALTLLIGLAFVVMAGNIPLSLGEETSPSENINTGLEGEIVNDLTVTEEMYQQFMATSVGEGSYISIDGTKSYTNFPFLSETPPSEAYLQFQATFSVSSSGGDWKQPYVKIVVIKDENGNGVPDPGTDSLWPHEHYKIKLPTESNWDMNRKWRTNVVYTGLDPQFQMQHANFGYGTTAAPIPYGDLTNTYMQDFGKTFSNTPEGYQSPTDQISWSLDPDGTMELKEDVSYVTIPTGSSTSIKGKVYCPVGYEGTTNFIWIRAYDARYADNPVAPSSNYLSQNVIEFTIQDGGGNGDEQPDVDITTSSSWSTVVTVGLISLGSLWVGRKLFF